MYFSPAYMDSPQERYSSDRVDTSSFFTYLPHFIHLAESIFYFHAKKTVLDGGLKFCL